MLLCDVGNTSYHFLNGVRSYKEDVKSFNPANIKEDVYFISVNASVNSSLVNLPNWRNLATTIDKSKYYETMGLDRIVALEAVHNAVIVDAGSAITVDVKCEGVFEGGFISAGLNAMSETYKNISPALSYEFNMALDTKKLPKNSQDAISYGYLKLLYSEVISYGLPIILTGGDSKSLTQLFPNAIHNENLIFDGMKELINKL